MNPAKTIKSDAVTVMEGGRLEKASGEVTSEGLKEEEFSRQRAQVEQRTFKE